MNLHENKKLFTDAVLAAAEQCWMYRDELYKGGTLKLTMGNQPNEKWGVENPPHCSE